MISCLICNKKLNLIKQSHLKMHGITREEYLELFPGAPLWSESYSANQAKGQVGKIMSGEARAKMSASRTGMVFTDERRSNISRGLIGHEVSEESRKKMSVSTKLSYQADPELRKRVSEGTQKGMASNNVKAKMLTGNIRRSQNFEWKAKISQTMKEQRSQPAFRSMMAQKTKAYFENNPEARNHLSRVKVEQILNKTFEWKNRRVYANEAAFVVQLNEMGIFYEKEKMRVPYFFGGKKKVYIPDFFLPDYNMVIETKSWYWLRRQGIKLNEVKLAACLDKGYEVVMIIDDVVVFHNEWLLPPSRFPA